MNGYDFLKDELNLWKGLPYTRDWSASPDFLRIIVNHCLEAKPSTIVECGSGLTSVILARCCELNGQGRLYSLEDGREYAANTRGYLDRYGLEGYANIIHAPLERRSIHGVEYLWYALEEIPDRPIEMLVIDGPSGFIQRHSRYPAVPLLVEKLTENCVVFLDDAAREDEKEIVELWKAGYPEIGHKFVETERGCSILTLGKGN